MRRRGRCVCVYLWTVGGVSSVRHLSEVGDVPPVARSERLEHKGGFLNGARVSTELLKTWKTSCFYHDSVLSEV